MNPPTGRVVRVGDGRFDSLSGELTLDGRSHILRPRTAAVLAYLVGHDDRVIGKDELINGVWPDVVVTEDSLTQCIKEIRHALGHRGRDWIRTVPRQGYAFVGNTQAVPAAPGSGAPLESDAATSQAPPAKAAGRPARLRLAILFSTFVILGALAALYAWRGVQPAREPAARFSVFVMPVVNLTGDPGNQKAADELTETLIDALARRSPITVIASSTSFRYKGSAVEPRRIGSELNVRYMLEASLKTASSRPVLLLRLIDTSTAMQLWIQEFTAETGGVSALRQDVIGPVVQTVGLQMTRADARRSGEPASIRATELLTRAREAMQASGHHQQGMLQVRQLVEEALGHDDRLPAAWAMLAMTYLQDVRFSATREQDLQRAAQAVQRALALAPDNDSLRVTEGNLYYEQGRMEQALATFERAVELNPNNGDAHARRGAALLMLGRAKEALVPIAHAMQLGPRDTRLWGWVNLAGAAHLHLGQDAAAVEWLTRAVEMNPRSPFSRLLLASALGRSGRIAEAQAQLAQLEQLRPGMTISRFRAAEPSNTEAFRRERERLYEGLRRAGMPE